MRIPLLTALLLLLAACVPGGREHYADFVDTGVGVIDKGASNCVIGPMLPYGSINPSPQSNKGTSDGYKPKEPIRGFGQLHVSGTGWPTYGNFLISPQTGLETDLLAHESEHQDLVTKPYLFATRLERYGITVEVSPAHYSAMYRLTYPALEQSSIVFDAIHSIAGDIFPKAAKTVISGASEIDPEAGTILMRIEMIGGWPEQPHALWCVAKIDKTDWTEFGSWSAEEYGSKERQGIAAAGQATLDLPHHDLAFNYGRYPGQTEIKAIPGCNDHVGSYCTFATQEGEQVLLKLATSFVGYDQAEALLDAEIPDWDFERVRDDARKAWDRKLSAVRIEGCSDEDRTIFYSGLYRFFTFAHERSLDRPGVTVDRRMARRLIEGKPLRKDAAGKPLKPYWDDNYAYWDTFRTVYPLLTLLDEDAYRDNVLALIERFETRGGVWDSFVAGTDRKSDQGGNNVDCLLCDGFVKGIPGIDWERAYAIVKHDADSLRLGHEQDGDDGAHLRYKELSWIPACLMSSSQTLEFAYNDWCAAQMAEGLGYKEDAQKYWERSQGWINLWNPDLESHGYRGFIDARRADSSFVFLDPAKWNGSWVSPFYEGKTWTYSYYVPHDMPRLIELMGGPEAFVERLNYGYEHKLTEYDNEPGFLTLRAFTDAGRPDLSSFWAHKLMNEKFTLKGYPDNEDTGSMGSWYAFCALGLFPDAGQDFYYLNAPKFRRAVLRLPRGKRLTIQADAARENIYIRSCTFRGRPVEGARIPHRSLLRGGSLKMQLDSIPPAL